MAKQRLDMLLVERGLAESRTQAQGMIMAGLVFSDTKAITKPGQAVNDDIVITIKGREHPWVSRGGMKLSRALEHFQISPKDKIALDVGASTGGFTDVLLHHSAVKVYAVDVGHGQLDWKIRSNPKVVVFEKVNARHLTKDQITDPIDIIVCDASFISLKTVLPTPINFAASGAYLIALIKPQFEVGKDNVGKGGIVSDPTLHQQVCDEIKNWLGDQQDWKVLGITDSPIHGADGNKEFLIAAQKSML